MSFDVRPCASLEEFKQAFFAIGQYFGPEPTDEQAERWLKVLRMERMHAAWEDGRVVGGAGAFDFRMTVSGGDVACAGVTVVGVYPTHRRRGVLRSLMRAQLDDARERGDALAALWASEETIYGRFGYGIASWCGEIEVPRTYSAFAAPFEREGRIRFVDAEEALELFPSVYEAVREQRPGMFRRSRDWWELRRLADPPERREGAGPKRFVVHETDGRATGYATYRHRSSWENAVSTGKIVVGEAMGSTPAGTSAIWRYLLDIDWAASVQAELLPPDHPLLFLLANPRRARFRLYDALWVRLVDVGAALSARTYREGGPVVFEVRDAFCDWNEGRWRLADGRAERTDDEPDLLLDADALGSVYLGGIPFAELQQALRVDELRSGAIARADALFRAPLHAWCPEIF